MGQRGRWPRLPSLKMCTTDSDCGRKWAALNFISRTCPSSPTTLNAAASPSRFQFLGNAPNGGQTECGCAPLGLSGLPSSLVVASC